MKPGEWIIVALISGAGFLAMLIWLLTTISDNPNPKAVKLFGKLALLLVFALSGYCAIGMYLLWK